MTPEDIGDIFQALEDALFAMAIRTMKHHENWEDEEGFQWTQWQAEQIQGLRAYRQNVRALTDYHFMLTKNAIESYLREAYRNSVDDAAETARQIMTLAGRTAEFSQQFFGVNSQKLDILINEAIQNIDTKRYAVINRMNSGYTDMLRRADIFAQSGSYTIPQAVDMAAKDFLSAGLNCVEYSNGNRVNIASYAEMALRTSSSEVTRQANGDVRDELGEHLVVSNVIAMTCPICQKWQGKVMIDDVYSNGKPDGKHKLVSESKADGFMHPNCRHQLYMYIPGLTEIADLPDTKITRERYKAEQQQRYQERQIRKYKRLRDGAMDPGNRQKYDARVKEWTERHDKFLENRDYLRRNPKRVNSEDVLPFSDNTIDHRNNALTNIARVSDKRFYIKEGIRYDVDGKNVILDHSDHEKEIGRLLSRIKNGHVEYIPRVTGKFKSIETPDYLFDGIETWDLKDYSGSSKDALRNIIKDKSGQANHFIIDVSDSSLSDIEFRRQAVIVFKAYNTSFVNEVIVIRNGNIVLSFTRV